MDKKEIKIEFCPETEMLTIIYGEKIIFDGNYWDFDRSPNNFKKFLEDLDFKVNYIKLAEDDIV